MAGAAPQSLPYAPSSAGMERQDLPITLRNYFQTLFWTAAAISACAMFYVIEKYVLIGSWHVLPNDSLYRMFKNPAEAPMRLFGMPHILIGTLFLITSRRMAGAKSWLTLSGLAALGVAFCWLFYQYGTVEKIEKTAAFGQVLAREPHPIALLIFYFYFLIHGFRDEAFFYKAYGDMPKNAGATHERLMVVMQMLMLGLLISLALPGYVIYGKFRPEFSHPALEQMFPANWPYPFWFALTFLPMVAVAAFSLKRIARQFDDGLRGLWRMHWPLLTVFAISTGIIIIALGTGPWTFNFVVLMHFVGWYLFGRYSLGKREPAERPKAIWQWMRSTRTGFTVLHLGLAAIFVVLVGVSVYAYGKQGTLDLLFGSKTFYYWTIMHVTLSFFPR